MNGRFNEVDFNTDEQIYICKTVDRSRKNTKNPKTTNIRLGEQDIDDNVSFNDNGKSIKIFINNFKVTSMPHALT